MRELSSFADTEPLYLMEPLRFLTNFRTFSSQFPWHMSSSDSFLSSSVTVLFSSSCTGRSSVEQSTFEPRA